MSLKFWVKLMFFLTSMALIYTHMQMQIFDLAYKGKDRERYIHDLKDKNGVLTHQVLTLKSANHLGNQLLEKDSNLQFMSYEHVLTMTGPTQNARQRTAAQIKGKTENSMWNFLSFLAPQEAKAWDRE